MTFRNRSNPEMRNRILSRFFKLVSNVSAKTSGWHPRIDMVMPHKPWHHHRPSRCHRSSRRGLGIVELLMAAILLSTMFLIAAPVLRIAMVTSRQDDRQTEALTTAANILEEITLQPWDEITSESAGNISLPDAIAQQLPEAELQVLVEPEGDAKRIRVQLSWQSTNDERSAPVGLTTWVYPTGAEP